MESRDFPTYIICDCQRKIKWNSWNGLYQILEMWIFCEID